MFENSIRLMVREDNTSCFEGAMELVISRDAQQSVRLAYSKDYSLREVSG